MQIVLPINIDFMEWASQIRIVLPAVTMPIPTSVDEWRDWASQVVSSNNLTNTPLPTELAYPNNEDWKKWAAYFINNLYT